MGYIKFKNKRTTQLVVVSIESPHVVRITADNIEVNTNGFHLYLDPDCKHPLDQAEYDMEAVHAERQALRDQINVLETQLAELTATAE